MKPERHSISLRCPACGSVFPHEVVLTSRGYSGNYENPPEGPEFEFTAPSSCPLCLAPFSEETQAALAVELEALTYKRTEPAPWDERDEPDSMLDAFEQDERNMGDDE